MRDTDGEEVDTKLEKRADRKAEPAPAASFKPPSASFGIDMLGLEEFVQPSDVSLDQPTPVEANKNF